MRIRLLWLCLLVSLFASAQQSSTPTSTSAQAVVPRLIRFSGTLKDATGTVGITFSLHKNQQDSAALWIETQNVQLDASGKYTVLLGVTKAEGIPAELFTSGEAQWLGIAVQGKPEQPRVLLVSVPYALRAAEADTLAGHAPADFVTTDKLSSAVQQELQQQATSSPASGTGKKAGIKASAPTETATNFIDNNGSQVVLVQQNGAGSGLTSFATTGLAVNAKSTGTAIYGISSGTGTSAGVEGVTSSPAGRGLYGFNTATTGENFGVVGAANSTQGIGVFGSNGATSGAAVGVWGTTTSTGGVALKGAATGASGATTGVLANVKSATGTAAVFQNSASGMLISGESGASNTVVFLVDGTGLVTALGGVDAGQGYFSGGPGFNGVLGEGGGQDGLYGGDGVTGRGGNNTSGTAGDAFSGTGGNVTSPGGIPGVGIAATGGSPVNGSANGVIGGEGGDFTGGEGDIAGGAGVAGQGGAVYTGNAQAAVGGYFVGGNSSAGNGGYGLYATPGATQTLAGWFQGNLVVTGQIFAGVKDFKIDHPLDPANKYLVHASVESSEMMNIYSGNIRLNEAGEATVTMPEWFEALNGDFRYQLTSIGAPGPNLFIKQELADGKFVVSGGMAGQKVSWTVTAVRHDAFATANPLVVEQEKQGVERGRYLHPDAFGKSQAESIGAAVAPKRNSIRHPAKPLPASAPKLASEARTQVSLAEPK
jgi:hypothetical protein